MNDIIAEQAAQMEAVKKDLLRKILTKEALERLGRVKIANNMLAAQLEIYLLQLSQTGQLEGTIDDEKLKQILDVIIPKKRKTKIRRK